MSEGLKVAYTAGCVMGFALVSLGVLFLLLLITCYTYWFCESVSDIPIMYEKIAGFGLGASCMALFGRVGGGIYTKAADVGADLVGKCELGLNEDSPQNPATIADNVGDNVGDIAGMGSDLFGSFAEATCATMVIASQNVTFYQNSSTIYYPVMLIALSIPLCIIVSAIIVFAGKAENYSQLASALKLQLILSTLLCILGFLLTTWLMLPTDLYDFVSTPRKWHYAFWCCTFGILGGLIIGFITEYYTSKEFRPVQSLSESCSTGAATNIIEGLALGHVSTILSILVLAIVILVVHLMLGMFGIALAAIGMLSNLPIVLAIDAYGPVCDNAGGIAEMCELHPETRERTDDLDAAGNTTAAIGKGFAIGSAVLVALALFCAFLSKVSNTPRMNYSFNRFDIIEPITFFGLIIGAMLPYAFSAFTMRSVGKAAMLMCDEVRDQFNNNYDLRMGRARPDYTACIKIATQASLKEMILPAVLVIFTPFIIGMLFGVKAIVGLIPGTIVSGVSMAISSVNSGGAWDNAKKYIESGECSLDGRQLAKGSFEHKAAVVGDTVGDPLKDTSGPALNILIKLMAIFSLVFFRFFDKTSWLYCAVSPKGSQGC